MCLFLFNRTTLQVFVTYLTGALYVHPLWFYKHQHDNRVRSKLFVGCQRWWFHWRVWFVPSVPGYLREEEEHKPDPWRNPIERNHMGLHLENDYDKLLNPWQTFRIILCFSSNRNSSSCIKRKCTGDRNSTHNQIVSTDGISCHKDSCTSVDAGKSGQKTYGDTWHYKCHSANNNT